MVTSQAQDKVVCVVDGDPAVRDSLQYLCNSNGHSAIGFSTQAAFLRALDDAHAAHAKSVICEAQLPDGSGVELYVELRQRGLLVPFALLVSTRSGLVMQHAAQAGVQYIWRKPMMDGRPLIEFLNQ